MSALRTLDYSGTISVGGTAQFATTGTDPDRQAMFLQNNSSGNLWFRFDGDDAAENGGLLVEAGAHWESPAHWVPGGPVSVYGATTGQGYSVQVAAD